MNPEAAITVREARPDDLGAVAAVVFVAEQAGRDLLGVIRIGTDPDEPAAGHVYSLYVRPDTQGLGVGTRLLAAADDRFRRDGMDEATLWVFAANAAARAFYSRLGWRPDGGERVEPQYGEPELGWRPDGGERVEPQYGEPELRLRRTLRDANGRQA